jgi:hypothetical protein
MAESFEELFKKLQATKRTFIINLSPKGYTGYVPLYSKAETKSNSMEGLLTELLHIAETHENREEARVRKMEEDYINKQPLPQFELTLDDLFP